jgi:hypothetical protein
MIPSSLCLCVVLPAAFIENAVAIGDALLIGVALR